MSKLYIIGDSYSSAAEKDKDIDPRTWMCRLAESLGVEEIVNKSQRGTSQEWAWRQLHQLIPDMLPEDYLVVVLTHPARKWYHRDYPEISRYEYIWKFKEIGLKPWFEAAKLYTERLQDPVLDQDSVEQRLAWLSQMIQIRGLRKPQVLLGFQFQIGASRSFPSIHVSWGDLCTVSENESDQLAGKDYYSRLITYVDFRYNHLCLSNHLVLTDKLAEAFETDQRVDLGQGFLDDMLNDLALGDQEWCSYEIDPELLAEHRKASATDPGILAKIRQAQQAHFKTTT
jgi:hypothetical protein